MDWAAEFFKDADTLDPDRMGRWFDEAVAVRFANQPAVHGKPAVMEMFKGFWSTIKTMSHRRERLITEGDSVCQEAIVTYVRLDGKEVSMPVASSLHRTPAGKIDRLFVFVDLAPLFAPA